MPHRVLSLILHYTCPLSAYWVDAVFSFSLPCRTGAPPGARLDSLSLRGDGTL